MTLVRYLSRVFASRFFAVLLALAALTQLMELLDAARQVFGAGRGAETLVVYSALRLPLALERLLPMAALIGAVLTFRRLVQDNELTILRAAGLSPYRILAALLPATALLAVAHFALVGRLAPAAERHFADWWQRIAPPEPDLGQLWLRVGEDIVSVGRVLEDGRVLEQVTHYRRDPAGLLTARLHAATATFGPDGWALQDVQETEVGKVTRTKAQVSWPGAPSVENLRQLTVPTERLSVSTTRNILAGQWSGAGSAAYYETKLLKTWRAPVLPVLMVLLATPALGGGRRTGGMARGTGLGLAMGLGFLIVDGFFGSMGEAGSLPAVLAVGAAPAIFAVMGAAVLLHAQE